MPLLALVFNTTKKKSSNCFHCWGWTVKVAKRELSFVNGPIVGFLTLKYRLECPCSLKCLQKGWSFIRTMLTFGSEPKNILLITSFKLASWEVFLANFNLIDLRTLLFVDSPYGNKCYHFFYNCGDWRRRELSTFIVITLLLRYWTEIPISKRI